MTYAASLGNANPSKPSVDPNVLAECIQACFDCAQACTADADADLGEQQVQTMIRCIRLCLDCSDVCLATGANPLAPDRLRPRRGARRSPGLRADLQGVRR